MPLCVVGASTYKRARKMQNQLQLGIIQNENGNMATTNERDKEGELGRETRTKITSMEGRIRWFPGREREGLNIQATCLRARAAM